MYKGKFSWKSPELGDKNVIDQTLVTSVRILLPPLYKSWDLGLIKIFLKAFNRYGEAFALIRNLFPSILDAKIEEGAFVDPDIRKL